MTALYRDGNIFQAAYDLLFQLFDGLKPTNIDPTDQMDHTLDTHRLSLSRWARREEIRLWLVGYRSSVWQNLKE